MRRWTLRGALPLLLASGGCSISSVATKALADTFAATGDTYARDDDPELVRDAVPFALKTMEQTLDAQPKHVGLLTALARNFTQYGYAFVQQDADRLLETDVARGKEVEARARHLFLRARDYGLRGLEIAHPGFTKAFLDGSDADRARVLAACNAADVPLLYWTGASWTLAIADGKDLMNLVGQLPRVEQVMARALALDEAWDAGALHDYFVAYDASRSVADGGGPDKARQHLERAVALSHGRRLGARVSFAEGVLVAAQDKQAFQSALGDVLAFDVDKFPSDRLANLVAQRRARWLLGRVGDLFAN